MNVTKDWLMQTLWQYADELQHQDDTDAQVRRSGLYALVNCLNGPDWPGNDLADAWLLDWLADMRTALCIAITEHDAEPIRLIADATAAYCERLLLALRRHTLH